MRSLKSFLKEMRKEERPLAVIAISMLFFICGAFATFLGVSRIAFGAGRLTDLLVLLGVVFIPCGYLILGVRHLRAGAIVALVSGLASAAALGIFGSLGLDFVLVGILPVVGGMLGLVAQPRARRIHLRKIKDFWFDFRSNRIGLMGIAIVFLFVLMGVFAPWITSQNQFGGDRVAERFSMPQWITFFPGHSDLPQTMRIPVDWSASSSDFVDVQRHEELLVNYTGGGDETSVHLHANFSYQCRPPPTFTIDFRWRATPVPEREVGYSLELVLVRWADGCGYSLWDSNVGSYDWTRVDPIPYKYDSVRPKPLPAKFVQIGLSDTYASQRFGLQSVENLTKTIFSEKGSYGLLMHIRFKPNSENVTCEIELSDVEFKILGSVYGVLGTDSLGRDIWSQLVYSTRVSMVIGLTAAVSLTVIGVLVGVISGYIGGVVDEALMRVVDALLCLPFLPLLMAMAKMFGQTYIYVIVLLAVFGWVGIARVVRSQALSIREKPFVESAKAVGAGRVYIMIKHVMPNVLPIAFAGMILSIPDAILTEAALSFLGLGDPRIMTWGKMLHNAFNWGGFRRLIFWWIIPPGLAIMILCIAFVFIGHSIDEVMNPRLRKRR